MKYNIGDRVIIKRIPLYSDIMDDIEEYFINKNGFIINIMERYNRLFFDINISGKIYTFYENDFVLDTVYYRNLKLGNILNEEQI